MQSQFSGQYLDLTEYEPRRIDADCIPASTLEALWREYSGKIAVDFPSPKTGGKIELTALGWVGYIPCNSDLVIRINPKVKLTNLFGMLEYAYDLKSFHLLKGLIDCSSMEEFYDNLANILAMKVLSKSKKGFYRAYLTENSRLPFVRGRLDIRKAIAKPYKISLPCNYEDHTADIIENQIIGWTLYSIARGGVCSERTIPAVRKAFRCLKGVVTVLPLKANDCRNIAYNRLNSDYQILHAICRFFLEHIGPHHEHGSSQMLPFLVDMDRLYELFVARWLSQHLPDGYSLTAQESMEIGEKQKLTYKIDLVINDLKNDRTYCVIDTKYKANNKPSNPDVNQVIAYAKLKECDQAFLVYPVHFENPFNIDFGDIKISSLSFSIADDLEEAGNTFIVDLFGKR